MPHYYIFNSAVIAAFGTYTYEFATPSRARAWLLSHVWESCICHEETAMALSELTSFSGKYPPISIPVNHKTVQMRCDEWNDDVEEYRGDEALVFRLVFPSGYCTEPSKKGSLGEEFIRNNCEIGILKRVA